MVLKTQRLKTEMCFCKLPIINVSALLLDVFDKKYLRLNSSQKHAGSCGWCIICELWYFQRLWKLTEVLT